MHSASVAVPVPEKPASPSACAFASVAVATALTRAESDICFGTRTTMLMVRPVRDGSGFESRRPGGTAAGSTQSVPTVARTVTPPWLARTARRTSAAVSIPTPPPRSPSPDASSPRCTRGSRRA